MLFDMGIGELLMIGVIGLVVFGPERLPRAAAQAAQFLRQLRDQANMAKATIIEAAEIDESTLRDIRDLDPRRALRDVASPLQDMRREVDGAVRSSTTATPKVTPIMPDSTSDTAAPSELPPRLPGLDPDDIV